MKLFGRCLIGAIVLSLCACQSGNLPWSSDNRHFDSNHRVASYVQENRVTETNYRVDLRLSKYNMFSGDASISFILHNKDHPLSLQLTQARVEQFTINGKKMVPDYDNNRIRIAPSLLNRGANRIHIRYKKKYSLSDSGLIRYRDPKDGEVYLYSRPDPYNAKIVPLFNQPNLKAVFDLTVEAPNKWKVISPTAIQHKTFGKKINRWQFATSTGINLHQLSLFAGPFYQWSSKVGKLPLHLFATQSSIKTINTRRWFKQTAQAFSFYNNQLGIPYPFDKYDQLLLPDLPTKVITGVATSAYAQPISKNNHSTMLQSLAQQWLDNRLILDPHDQRWFTQSLATFVANKAQLTQSPTPVLWQDSRHSDLTDSIDDNDRQKGIALLTQLEFLVGETTFDRGLKSFLRRYNAQKSTLDKFITSIGNAAKQPLDDWATKWNQPGINRIEVQYRCKKSSIDYINLKQSTRGDSKVLRHQKIKLALFNLNTWSFHRSRVVTVNYQGKNTKIKALQGERCPDLIVPNYQNLGYVQVKFDPVSLKILLRQINKINDNRLRLMLWQTLWDNVLSGDLPLNQFLGSVFINLPQEQDPQILTQVLNKLVQAKAFIEQMSPSHQSYGQQLLLGIEQMSLRLAMARQSTQQIEALWFDNYIKFATSKQTLSHLATLLTTRTKFNRIKLDQQRRWAIIIHLNRYNYADAKHLLIQEKQRDKSLKGKMAALSARVVQPNARQKLYYLNHVQSHRSTDDNDITDQLTTVMTHLYPDEQQVLNSATAEKRLTKLAYIDAENNSHYMKIYTRQLLPMDCSYYGIMHLNKQLNHHPALSLTTINGIKQAIQTERQCLSIKKHLGQ